MKLTNQQIDALKASAERANREIRDKELDALKKDPVIQKEATKYMKVIEQIPLNVRKQIYGLRDIDKDDFIDHLIDKKSLKTPELDGYRLRNDILIASIDSKDLDELQKKLNIKLK